MTETEFLRHFISHAPQLMWFLGAGTSRTAGMPTATDITWDLKLRYYCLNENQDLNQHDINKDAVKKQIQDFLDSKGFPKINNANEYSFYFDLSFGNNYAEQQSYLADKLSTQKISLNVGHRAIAALISLSKIKIVFTTNFDHVIESAYSKVTGNNLSSFHLEGSYAALDALNSETFPIYAKLHGDFKYQSIKNLSVDLATNDKKIQDCFLAASARYGLVLSGYSGRDKNVMEMLYKAIDLHNAFPMGIFWTVPSVKETSETVLQFIHEAQKKGINAQIIETGTFDTLLSKIWRQIENKPRELDEKVRSSTINKVLIPFLEKGNNFPLLRSNALPIIECPTTCAWITLKRELPREEFIQILSEKKPNITVVKHDKILAWGEEKEFINAFGENITSINSFPLSSPLQLIQSSPTLKSFFEKALVMSLTSDKPLTFKKNKHHHYILINHAMQSNPLFNALKSSVAGYGKTEGPIVGKVSNSTNVFWSEACEVKLEEKNNLLWLLIQPTIWITPVEERKNHVEFIRSRRGKRYNPIANALLDAWIKILLNQESSGDSVETQCYNQSKYPIKFKINSRTSFSKR